MLDHVGIPVSDYARSKAFYTAVFAPLGYGLVMEVTPEMTGDGSSAAGFGKGKPDFWISDTTAIRARTWPCRPPKATSSRLTRSRLTLVPSHGAPGIAALPPE